MAPFKATISLPVGEGDKVSHCVFEVPSAAFKKAGEEDSTTRTQERIADFSSALILTVVGATNDAEIQRPAKKQRCGTPPTESSDEPSTGARDEELGIQLHHRGTESKFRIKPHDTFEEVLRTWKKQWGNSVHDKYNLVYDGTVLRKRHTPSNLDMRSRAQLQVVADCMNYSRLTE
ncbi:uncharacterized protein LTR77_010153 [Saxophila tyrrhenica]|uniref:Rad60/SUMO-like domain-containing protein n=1 Tax=Saxophila tyrrhenica TaxID=1690608 RepID=A0AAV9NW36_9PEZI|nr:hypothetical protein LTR77_010153 [Saxophila tyrrhenica]